MRVTHDHLRRFAGGTLVFKDLCGRVLSATIDCVELEGIISERRIVVRFTGSALRTPDGPTVTAHSDVWRCSLTGHSLRGLNDSVGVVEVSWASTLALRALLIPPGLEHLEGLAFGLWRHPIAA